jgi:hypothetical protein
MDASGSCPLCLTPPCKLLKSRFERLFFHCADHCRLYQHKTSNIDGAIPGPREPRQTDQSGWLSGAAAVVSTLAKQNAPSRIPSGYFAINGPCCCGLNENADFYDFCWTSRINGQPAERPCSCGLGGIATSRVNLLPLCERVSVHKSRHGSGFSPTQNSRMHIGNT